MLYCSITLYLLIKDQKYLSKLRSIFMITNEHIAHSVGVARYMHTHANEYDLPKNQMFVLGLLHDIGYIVSDTDHEAAGYHLLAELGFTFADIIAWQGMPPEYYLRATDNKSLPKELELLYEAELATSKVGSVISLEEKFKEIASTYGTASRELHNARTTAKWLQDRNKDAPDVDWISIKYKLPEPNVIVKVKLTNGCEEFDFINTPFNKNMPFQHYCAVAWRYATNDELNEFLHKHS